MEYRIGPQDRTRFKRCRRQWDFASPLRRGLEFVDPPVFSPAATALTQALAVYYYPGTWDWQRDLKQSLVQKAAYRSLADADALRELGRCSSFLTCYDAWAVTVDDFAPVKIQQDVSALVRDPAEPERGLTAPDGSAVVYACRVDLLAVDARDEYWLVRHELRSEHWRPMTELLLDEEALAACWAWQQDYIGMQIAGTIHNEIRVDDTRSLPADDMAADAAESVAQHGASGGGRSIPQHVRISALQARPDDRDRIEQRTAGPIRRTRIRRGRDEIAAAGKAIAVEAIEMTRSPAVYPSPGPHCVECEFTKPCQAMFEGADPEALLAAGFRRHSEGERNRPRLGQATWGFGRGAAPPNW